MQTGLSDSEALLLVKQLVDVAGTGAHRRPFERTALRNRLFYLGKHWFIEDPRTGFFREPALDGRSNKVLYKANLILGNTLRSILTVSGAQAEFVVPPKKATRTAEKAAWVSTKLFEHLTEATRLRWKRMLACLMAACDGAAIWKVRWNSERGDLQRFYLPPELGGKAALALSDLQRAELEDSGRYEDRAVGDVELELKSIFEFEWDWNARDGGIEDAEWVAEKRVVTRDRLRETYGRKIDDVPATDQREGGLYWQELVSFMTGQFGSGLGADPRTTRDDDDRVLLVEYWERPKPSNKGKGRYLVIAGDTVLENRDNKYRETKYPLPFVRQNWVHCPGRFWGISLVENLTSPQRQYNMARSKVIQHQNAFGTPATFIPKGWDVPEHFITTEPGALIRYNQNAGGRMESAPPPLLPKEVAENAMQAKGELAEISSQQGLENSNLPGQIRSAPGLELMLDERNKLLIHPAENFVLALVDVGRHMLELAHKRYDEGRILSYVGEDRRYRVLHFKRATVDTDLRVIVDQQKLLSSPTAVRARIMEMAQNGVLDPLNRPEDREDVLRALDFNSVDRMVSDRLQEEENQEREIEEMIADPEGWIQPRADMMAPESAFQENPETGALEPPVVQGYPSNPYDDDEAHARVLRRFMRGEEFRGLDPFAQQVLLLHLQEHQGKLQAAMMQQLAMQEALKGTAGEKGSPSKPKAPAPA